MDLNPILNYGFYVVVIGMLLIMQAPRIKSVVAWAWRKTFGRAASPETGTPASLSVSSLPAGEMTVGQWCELCLRIRNRYEAVGAKEAVAAMNAALPQFLDSKPVTTTTIETTQVPIA